jgi:hypothetical protein
LLHTGHARDRIPNEVKTGVQLYFIGALIALILLFAAVQAFVVLGSSFDHVHGSASAPAVMAVLARHAFATVLAATLGAAPLAMSRLLRRNRKPTGSLLLLFVLVSLALYGGALGAARLTKRASQATEARMSPVAGSFLTKDDISLYVDERFGDYELRRVLVHDRTGEQGAARFRLYPRVLLQPDSGLIVFPDGAQPFSLVDVLQAPWTMFDPPASVRTISADLTAGAGVLSGIIAADRLAGIAAVIALSFVLTASWVFVRLTRWPLLNVMLVLGWIRLLLALIVVAVDPRFIELFEPFLAIPSEWRVFIVPATLTVIGMLLLVINSILPSFDHWRREVHGV